MTAEPSTWVRTAAMALALVAAGAAERTFSQTPSGPQPVTAAQYERWKTELSNWGRWGKDDQIGTLNLITPAKRREAAALVRDGVSVSLAADADTEKAVDNPSPYEYAMLGIGSDRIGIAYTASPTPTSTPGTTSTPTACSTTATRRMPRRWPGRGTSATRSSTSRTGSSRAAS